jgi:hypothetical protein
MTSVTRRRLGRRFGAVFAVTAAFVLLFASPAAASTFNGNYYTPAGNNGGSYQWTECGSGCAENHNISVRDNRDGYHVRARLQAKVDGTYYTYLDKVLSNGNSGKWKVDHLPVGPIRVMICFYNSNWDPVGTCFIRYGSHSS